MKDPYRALWFWAESANFATGGWFYNVKRRADAFYIGTDDEHITIMEGSDGFHHSFNERGEHVTGRQHERCTTLLSIIGHINANQGAYRNRQTIVNALEYLNNHRANM